MVSMLTALLDVFLTEASEKPHSFRGCIW